MKLCYKMTRTYTVTDVGRQLIQIPFNSITMYFALNSFLHSSPNYPTQTVHLVKKIPCCLFYTASSTTIIYEGSPGGHLKIWKTSNICKLPHINVVVLLRSSDRV